MKCSDMFQKNNLSNSELGNRKISYIAKPRIPVSKISNICINLTAKQHLQKSTMSYDTPVTKSKPKHHHPSKHENDTKKDWKDNRLLFFDIRKYIQKERACFAAYSGTKCLRLLNSDNTNSRAMIIDGELLGFLSNGEGRTLQDPIINKLDIIDGVTLSDRSILLFARRYGKEHGNRQNNNSLVFIHQLFDFNELDYTIEEFESEDFVCITSFFAYYDKSIQTTGTVTSDDVFDFVNYKHILVHSICDDGSVMYHKFNSLAKKGFFTKFFGGFWTFFQAVMKTIFVFLLFPYLYMSIVFSWKLIWRIIYQISQKCLRKIFYEENETELDENQPLETGDNEAIPEMGQKTEDQLEHKSVSEDMLNMPIDIDTDPGQENRPEPEHESEDPQPLQNILAELNAEDPNLTDN